MHNYYDALFFDEEGLKQYSEFVLKHAQGTTLIEMACGTGDLLNVLQDRFDLTGVDIDPSMIGQVKEKYPELKAELIVGDFTNFKINKQFDTAVCIGDSSNHLLDFEDMDKFVNVMTKLSDCIILDCHHPFRLSEFSNDYYEEGSTKDFDYAYQIEVENQNLVHVINFLDGTFDTIYQWVFDPKELIKRFEKAGYYVQVFTDHITKGMQPEGEKICMVAKKQ